MWNRIFTCSWTNVIYKGSFSPHGLNIPINGNLLCVNLWGWGRKKKNYKDHSKREGERIKEKYAHRKGNHERKILNNVAFLIAKKCFRFPLYLLWQSETSNLRTMIFVLAIKKALFGNWTTLIGLSLRLSFKPKTNKDWSAFISHES